MESVKPNGLWLHTPGWMPDLPNQRSCREASVTIPIRGLREREWISPRLPKGRASASSANALSQVCAGRSDGRVTLSGAHAPDVDRVGLADLDAELSASWSAMRASATRRPAVANTNDS